MRPYTLYFGNCSCQTVSRPIVYIDYCVANVNRENNLDTCTVFQSYGGKYQNHARTVFRDVDKNRNRSAVLCLILLYQSRFSEIEGVLVLIGRLHDSVWQQVMIRKHGMKWNELTLGSIHDWISCPPFLLLLRTFLSCQHQTNFYFEM